MFYIYIYIHIYILKTKPQTTNQDGEVLTCGRGSYGQLGHGDSKSRGEATIVEALKGVVVVKVAAPSFLAPAVRNVSGRARLR